MKFSWNNIRSALLITLGLTMVLMGIAWAIDPLPVTTTSAPATTPDSAAFAATLAQAAALSAPAPAAQAPAPFIASAPSAAPTGMGTTTAATGLPISNQAPASDDNTEVVEAEITEEVDSPTQPGKKIKRKRKVKYRRKKAGKRGGMKFPKRKKSKGSAPLGMPRGQNPSQMTPQQRQQWELARRNQLVQAQRKRALMRIQRTPMSNLAKLRARQIQLLPPGAKKYGSRKTIGMTPGKSGKKGTRKKDKSKNSGKAQAQDAQAEGADTTEQSDSSAEASTSGDEASAEPASES